MNLSTRTRYGMMALVELGKAYNDKPLSVKELAARQNISRKYLEKIIASLRMGGFVRSVRGLHGGYALAKAPDELGLKTLFEALEGTTAFVECLEEGALCENVSLCSTQSLWRDLSDAMNKILEKRTLQDLIDSAPVVEDRALSFDI